MKLGFTTASHAVLSIMAGWAITVSAASAATDPGVRAGVSTGDPVPGLTADQKTLFFLGQDNFAEKEDLGDGLGPRFNLDSCVGCHISPTHGGSSPPVNPQATVATALGAKNILPTFITANGPIREARFKFLANGPYGAGPPTGTTAKQRTGAASTTTKAGSWWRCHSIRISAIPGNGRTSRTIRRSIRRSEFASA